MTQQVAIPQEVFQAMADYITKQPYREVAQLVEAIKVAKLITVQEPEKPAEPENVVAG